MPLLEHTTAGWYCQRAGIFVDPARGVSNALITHAHSDHARSGSRRYLCTPVTGHLLRHRLGTHLDIQSLRYDERLKINGVAISFHPAGHVPGSAQVRFEHKGEVWVVSGDYKADHDGLAEPFEPVRCHTFITESTFALPVYQWPDQYRVYEDLNGWWRENAAAGISSIVAAYALGKAQRILHHLDQGIGPVYCHTQIENINVVLRMAGIGIKPTNTLTDHHISDHALVIAPSSVLTSEWMSRFKLYKTAAASGWMLLRGRKRWQHVDKAFVLSDHADWNALNHVITETGCTSVITTHGYADQFARWLRARGYQAEAEVSSRGGAIT